MRLQLAPQGRLARGLAVATVAALAAAPRVASACAVCSAGRDDKTQGAFLFGSIFLSVLPPAVVGGIAWWIWRRARQIAAEEAAGVIRLPERLPLRTASEANAGPGAAERPVPMRPRAVGR